ncbi:hypothetical protein NPIL_124581 [Nephila pilipes]|uniref:Uncharacterized protein n=1 Tax=Nephila pilipes TaxID=299642 RepID=A0A8X6T4Z0_NEPPI|nr:hypothetical protein NPIL_124581 [Nephila pilipes]
MIPFNTALRGLITLYWIKGYSRRRKSLVQNRVNEIQKLTNPDSWFYCSTKTNPADLSRGVSPASMETSNKWWTFAEFLMETQFSSQCLLRVFHEVECLILNEKES